jgi:hypothetical protein
MTLYSSEWRICTITALSAPYSTIFCYCRAEPDQTLVGFGSIGALGVTDRSRGSRERGELSFHMKARLNSIPFCEVPPGKPSGECDMAVYLSLP